LRRAGLCARNEAVEEVRTSVVKGGSQPVQEGLRVDCSVRPYLGAKEGGEKTVTVVIYLHGTIKVTDEGTNV